MKRSIMCRSADYNSSGTFQGMDMTGRVWVVLAEDDARGWASGSRILTSPALRVDLGPEYTHIHTANSTYVVDTANYKMHPQPLAKWYKKTLFSWHNEPESYGTNDCVDEKEARHEYELMMLERDEAAND